MKKLIYLLCFMVFLTFACNDTNDTKEENNDNDTSETIISDEMNEEFDSKHLIIIGDDIWVRSKPISGDVVMKLNTGDKCEILEISDEDQIKGDLDYWYKIKFNDKVGWVFGSQTNKKSRMINDVLPFEHYFGDIARRYSDKTEDLYGYTMDTLLYVFLYNMGAYCTEYSSENLIREVPVQINDDNIYNRKPKGDFCEGYPGEKSGFYFWPIKYKELPSYFDMAGEGSVKHIELPEKYTNNSFMIVQVITEEYHFSYMYFINIERTWYLICENHCDCSA